MPLQLHWSRFGSMQVELFINLANVSHSALFQISMEFYGYFLPLQIPFYYFLLSRNKNYQPEIFSMSKLFSGPRGTFRAPARGQAPRVCVYVCVFLFLPHFFSTVSSRCIGCCNVGIDWIISVSSDSEVFYTNPLLLLHDSCHLWDDPAWLLWRGIVSVFINQLILKQPSNIPLLGPQLTN